MPSTPTGGESSNLLLNAPNLLSAFRLLCVPALLGLAWHGAATPFLVLFGLGLLSDVLDGVAARRLGQESELGARLDQTADFAIWSCLPLAAWWLWWRSPRFAAGNRARDKALASGNHSWQDVGEDRSRSHARTPTATQPFSRATRGYPACCRPHDLVGDGNRADTPTGQGSQHHATTESQLFTK